ncbi:MAG: DUF3786 domain-containing protein, partial [Candidatus Bathyarchaeia archaeon]
ISGLFRKDAPQISQIVSGKLLEGSPAGFEAHILGVNYRVTLEKGEVKVHVDDPLGRSEDYTRLITYVANALERALDGRLVSRMGKLVKLPQLPGGEAAQLYERRIVNFLVAEMDGVDPDEIRIAAEKIGGVWVNHSSATWSIELAPLNGVRFRVAYWQGDEEISSEAAILLGEEVKDTNMPMGELIAIMEMAINRLVLFYRKTFGKRAKLFESLYL